MKSRWKSLSIDGRIEAVRKAYLAASRSSAAAIAEQLSEDMGEPLSRNVIIGMTNRHREKMQDIKLGGEHPTEDLCLSPFMQKLHDGLAEKRRQQKLRREAALKTVRQKPQSAPTVKPVARKEVPIVDLTPESVNIGIGPRQLYELGPKDCRWPIDGTGNPTLFCAKDIGRHHMWCEAHQKSGYMAR